MNRSEARSAGQAFAVAFYGTAATYTPVDGAAYAVTVVPRYNQERVDAQGFMVRRDVFHVQRADLAREPKQGDRITIGAEVHEVETWEDASHGARRVLLVRRILRP